LANPHPVPAAPAHRDMASPAGHPSAVDGGLHRIQAEMNAALASMSDAIWIADAGGRTLRVNDAFLKVHRFTDALSGTLPLEDYFQIFHVRHPDGGRVEHADWPGARALRGESATSQVFELQRCDTGETWIMSYSYAPILAEDGLQVCGAVVTSRNVTEHFRMQQEIQASRARLRRMLAAQDSATEMERRRIARDLHDDLQQHLAAIRIELASAVSGWITDPDELAALMRRAHDMAGDAIESVRRIVQDLRPRILDGEGLSGALRGLLDGFGERTQLPCRFIGHDAESHTPGIDADDTLDEDLAVTLYRVAQEALTNIHKHAQAASVEVRLDRDDAGWVRMSVRDDGIGVSSQDFERNHSLGILGMQERLAAHGGRLEVRGRPDGGTVVEALAPATAQVAPAAYRKAAERERERERRWWQNPGPDPAAVTDRTSAS
jgi:signal transduction histidine kinase